MTGGGHRKNMPVSLQSREGRGGSQAKARWQRTKWPCGIAPASVRDATSAVLSAPVPALAPVRAPGPAPFLLAISISICICICICISISTSASASVRVPAAVPTCAPDPASARAPVRDPAGPGSDAALALAVALASAFASVSGVPVTCRNSGASTSHRSVRRGHRGWNRQPRGGSMGVGTVPSRMILCRRRCRSMLGIADRSACVYGWSGFSNNSSVGATSTTCPRYITATLWLMWYTTRRSWVMKR